MLPQSERTDEDESLQRCPCSATHMAQGVTKGKLGNAETTSAEGGVQDGSGQTARDSKAERGHTINCPLYHGHT